MTILQKEIELASQTTYSAENCCAIILAAGRSKRMGTPKQLLVFGGKNLLQHTIDTVRASFVNKIIVVLGYEAEIIAPKIDAKGLKIVMNEDWPTGMASSIKAGMKVIVEDADSIDRVILLVCDQPFIEAKLIDDLIDQQKQSGKPVVASVYGGKVGVPALFDKSYFYLLSELSGDEGARKIIRENLNDVAEVAFPRGEIDIDTPAAYESIKQNFNQ